jgi:hypothetical protein
MDGPLMPFSQQDFARARIVFGSISAVLLTKSRMNSSAAREPPLAA